MTKNDIDAWNLKPEKRIYFDTNMEWAFGLYKKKREQTRSIKISTIDELNDTVKKLKDNCDFFIETNELIKAEETICELLNLAELNYLKDLEAYSYVVLSRISMKKFDYHSVLYYCHLGLEIKEDFEMYYNTSVAYLRLGLYEEASDFSDYAMIFSKKANNNPEAFDKSMILNGVIYFDAAIVYRESEELLDIAKFYFEQVESNSENLVRFQTAQINIAAVEEKSGHTKEARKRLLSVLNNLITSKHEKNIYFRIAHTYYIDGDYLMSKNYCLKAIDKLDRSGNDYFEMDFYLLLGKINYELNMLDDAKGNATRVYKMANSTPEYTNQVAESSKLLSNIYEKEGNKDSILYFTNSYIKIRDEIATKNDDNKLLFRHLVDKHENNIANEKSKIFNFHSTIYMLLLLIILIVLVVLIQNKKSQKVSAFELHSELNFLKDKLNISLLNNNKIGINRCLDKGRIESKMSCKLNDTDWKILQSLVVNPMISNYDLAEQVYRSIAGVRSSLKKMYSIFGIDNNYRDKRILLVMKAVDLSEEKA
ncbi:MAG: winged helix-turn-helix domain-containing protein [Flavobacteriaceae bacterium]|nr:winged helix-turn-helix domain-containing protein [Flavobacteriaceae bacterium]